MKIELFREMCELNEAFERIIEGLRRLEKFPFLCRELVQGTRAEAVVLQVEANGFFFDKFERIVGDDARWAYKFLNDARERLKDPEHVYLEVKHREEARKKKGLPPRVTFLADWDSGDERVHDSGGMSDPTLSRAVVVTMIGNCSAFAALARATTLCFSSAVE